MPANLQRNVVYGKSKLASGIKRFSITVEVTFRQPIHKSTGSYLQGLGGVRIEDAMFKNQRAIVLGNYSRRSSEKYQQ
jgi:hypothetical protein